jgi:hypothetical protein
MFWKRWILDVKWQLEMGIVLREVRTPKRHARRLDEARCPKSAATLSTICNQKKNPISIHSYILIHSHLS